MSYQLLPNIIFIVAILGIILLILRRLPEATSAEENPESPNSPARTLMAKGLPAIAISRTKTVLKLWVKKTWNFVLEAKDLRPTSAVGYKIKKIFQATNAQIFAPKFPVALKPEAIKSQKKEDNFFELIKKEPKNLVHYDSLGKYYLGTHNYSDAKDIYLYLSNHEPGNSDFLARLAYCCYQLKDYALAAENYQKSLALDSNQPNRYYNLAICFEHLGNYEEVIKALGRAIELEPQNQRFLTGLSKAYLKMGNGEKAQILLNEVEKLKQKNVNP